MVGSTMQVCGSLDNSIAAIIRIGREGEGNEAATAAWKDVVSSGPDALLAVINAAGKGSVVADNWLRSASEVIVETALKSKQVLPADSVEGFIKDRNNSAAGRQLAFDVLRAMDAKRAGQLEPSLADDPVQSLRRGAVHRLISAAKAKQGDDAIAAYRIALDAVRDEDQTKDIVKALKALGVTVDLRRHFGFLTRWHLVGPFENTDRKGFDAVYAPEKSVDFGASLDGKGKQVGWAAFESTDDYGKVDFNKPLGMLKESAAYAVTTVQSESDRDAELRLGCKNAWKVWLNGELLFGRDEYHRGQQMDQYKLKCRLKKGANTVLVKCCQNEQKEDWTVEWEFQLRLCDSAGTAIVSADVAQ